MFSKLLVLSGVLALCNADMDMNYTMNDTDTAVNFFVDYFETALYPFPTGICVQTGLLSASYATYICNEDGTEVTKTTYSDSDCTSSTDTDVYTSETITEEGIYDFECNGENSYSELFLCVSGSTCTSCPLGSATIYAAMFTCTYSGGNATVYTSCNANETSLIAYPESDTCSMVDGVNTTTLAATPDCAYFYSTSFGSATIDIYAQTTGCYINVPSPTPAPTGVPTPMPSGGSSDSGDDDDDDDDDDSAIKLNSIVVSLFALVMGYLFM